MNTQPLSSARSFFCAVLLALVAAVSFTLGASAATSAPMVRVANGELVITRSFSLAGLPVEIVIDGKRVTTLSFNRNYHAPIAAGWHRVLVRQVPETQRSRSPELRLLVQGGKTYELTATRIGPQVVLQKTRS